MNHFVPQYIFVSFFAFVYVVCKFQMFHVIIFNLKVHMNINTLGRAALCKSELINFGWLPFVCRSPPCAGILVCRSPPRAIHLTKFYECDPARKRDTRRPV